MPCICNAEDPIWIARGVEIGFTILQVTAVFKEVIFSKIQTSSFATTGAQRHQIFAAPVLAVVVDSGSLSPSKPRLAVPLCILFWQLVAPNASCHMLHFDDAIILIWFGSCHIMQMDKNCSIWAKAAVILAVVQMHGQGITLSLCILEIRTVGVPLFLANCQLFPHGQDGFFETAERAVMATLWPTLHLLQMPQSMQTTQGINCCL
mmetsp:Transcript_133998/g.218169  ORF Transcript_133998/g.218169 Transcript_133998/m.218169 type:complete len:206 (-) Transcript_133998:303-920(-)